VYILQGAPGVAGMRGPRGFMGRPGLEVSHRIITATSGVTMVG